METRAIVKSAGKREFDEYYNIGKSRYCGNIREFVRNGINDGSIDSELFSEFVIIGYSGIYVKTV